ncbi:hypothetical protein J6590_017340 [Homalodisca vitripennis]|nr:hypothetical protein J6590_017340 [Homalodisca vitripennis]
MKSLSSITEEPAAFPWIANDPGIKTDDEAFLQRVAVMLLGRMLIKTSAFPWLSPE